MNSFILVVASLLATVLPQLAQAEVIDYEVLEVSRIGTRVIANGKRDYSPNEVKVHPYERDGKYIAEKLLELEQGFKIGARIFTEKDLTGFGLIAQQSDRDFSWEWFSQETGSQFKKLQGGQLVEVQTQRLPFGEELVQILFLADTTLRFKPRGETDFTHHIVIRAGSVLRLK
jgi:hypothetical protein